MKATKTLLYLVLCAALITGCAQQEAPVSNPGPAPSSSPAPAEPEPEIAPSPQPGGVLRVAMRLPLTMNPLLNEDATVANVLRLLFEPLSEPDEAQRPTNRLAENINFASDGMSVIITLNDGLQWADGTPITAYDVEYSIETLMAAPEQAVYKDCVRNVASCTVMDDRNARIGYYQPFGGSAYLLNFPVIPKHFYANAPDSLEAVLGSGAYRFSRFERQELLVLEASTDAYGNSPYIGEIHAVITSDRETDLHAFEQGVIDFVRADLSDWGRLANSSKQLKAYSFPAHYFDFIGFNFANETFQALSVRQAVAHAVDKDSLLHDVYPDNGGVVVNAPISAGSWLFELDAMRYPFDAEKAAGLLARSGVRVVRVLVNEENEERAKIAEMLRKNLSSQDVTVVVESEPFEVFEQRMADGDFDLVVAGFSLSPIPELTFAFGSEGALNYFSYADPEMDALLEAMFAAPIEGAYRRAASDLQYYFARELPCVSLVFRNSVVLTDARVYGVEQPTAANPFAGVGQWFIYE